MFRMRFPPSSCPAEAGWIAGNVSVPGEERDSRGLCSHLLKHFWHASAILVSPVDPVHIWRGGNGWAGVGKNGNKGQAKDQVSESGVFDRFSGFAAARAWHSWSGMHPAMREKVESRPSIHQSGIHSSLSNRNYYDYDYFRFPPPWLLMSPPG